MNPQFKVTGRNLEISEATRKRNPELYGVKSITVTNYSPVKKEAKRIRQDEKPLLNKLESQWLHILKIKYPDVEIRAQSWRVRIANGSWFKVDFCALINGRWTAWECKGPKQGKNVARGTLALKCAAGIYSEVDWILVWKEDGKWQEQKVLS